MPQGDTSRRPNILWISLEDTSPRFGCTGDPLACTPHIDRLAAEGCRFPNAFSTAGVCAPSRSAIITGMYPAAIGTHQMRTTHTNPATPELPTPYEAVPPHYVKGFPEYLRRAGYFCTNNEKTDYQFKPPRTMWDELGKHAHWRNRTHPNQPFFAVFNPTVTHESGMWPKDREEIVTDPDAVTLPPYLPDTPKARLALARHYDNLERADRIVGEILRQLDEDGLAENTLVFLWSDHGEGLPRGKRWPYDRGIRIPLLVRWPGRLEPSTVDDRLVSLVDLAPTVLSLAGVPLPCHLHGQPFLGPYIGPEREYVFATRDRHDEFYDMVRAARDRRYKYLRHFCPELPYLLWNPYRNRHPVMQEMWRLHAEGELAGPGTLMFQPRPPEEMYDTEADPWEMNNLAEDPAHRETLLRLRAALDDWRRDYGDMGEIPEAEMVERMWPGGKQPRTAAPVFVPITNDQPGLAVANGGGSFLAPCLLQIHCATQGASIAYTLEEGEDARWSVYTQPLRLPAGTTTLRALAHRIGYAESGEQAAAFTVGDPAPVPDEPKRNP